MGNKASRPGGKLTSSIPTLKPKDLQRLSYTNYNPEELQALYLQFMSMKSPDNADIPSLSIEEFQNALGFTKDRSSKFVERVFYLMDGDKDGALIFEEFLEGVSIFAPTSTDKKYRFTFSIYDIDGKGHITPFDLSSLLSSILSENGIDMTKPQIDQLVVETFRLYDTNQDGVIDYNEYVSMCELNPSILRPLTLHVGDIIASAKATAAAMEQAFNTSSPVKK